MTWPQRPGGEADDLDHNPRLKIIDNPGCNASSLRAPPLSIEPARTDMKSLRPDPQTVAILKPSTRWPQSRWSRMIHRMRPNFLGAVACLILASTCLAQEAAWDRVATKNFPPARWGHSIAYDSFNGLTIVFSGNDRNLQKLSDIWEYDGTDWTQVNASGPRARQSATMVGMRVGKVLLFGGYNGGYNAETWLYDSITKKWSYQRVKTLPPEMRSTMVYDSDRDRVVMFGGRGVKNGVTTDFGDTWEYDGADWTKIATKTSPALRSGHFMAYDSARKRVVLFGGSRNGRADQATNDTWEYDGTDWMEILPATKPSVRTAGGMAYDTTRKRTVLFGGCDSVNFYDETWEWDGKSWTQIKAGSYTQPNARNLPGMVYDQKRKRAVLYGGKDPGLQVVPPDTWEYEWPETLTGSPSTISVATGGTQTFQLDAGTQNAGRLYWIFGSVTGTCPVLPLGAATIPLVPDVWTELTMSLTNTPLLQNTRGTLDGSGQATASFNVPIIKDPAAVGVKLYKAHLIYDASGNIYEASNPVTLTLVK